jgi:hypothetical protein
MKSLSKRTIKLRGHHLVCLHFFRGEGYNTEYVENLRRILERVEAGAEIEVSAEADDVCGVCPSLKGGKCSYAADAEIGIREMDMTALSLLGLTDRDYVRWADMREKLPEIFPQWTSRYCKACGWRKACEKQEKFYRFADG